MLPSCVEGFFVFHGDLPVMAITGEHIRKFCRWLEVRPNKRTAGALSESYIYQHIYALRVFFSWLEECGELGDNPMNHITIKPPHRKERDALSKAEIGLLFEHCQSHKQRAVLHLFYSCGLRRSEAERLNLTEISFRKSLLYVRSGKGNKRRVVPMTEKVSHELELYFLTERGIGMMNDQDAFMINRIGNRVSGNSYNQALKKIVRQAGLERACTLHHLRHSIATHLLENGLSLEEVRDFLGHKHLEATQIYVKVSRNQIDELQDEEQNPEKLKL